jgi:hypothetical protein
MTPPSSDREVIMNQIIDDVGIVRRDAWSAKSPTTSLDLDWDYDSIVIHNSGHGHLDTMLKIQKFDLEKRHWEDISYHYGIMPDGTIFEGRQLIYKGADVKNQNTGKIGIVCIGDYDSGVVNWFSGRAYKGDPVLPKMLDSVRKLTRRLMAAFPTIVRFGGHIEYGDTSDCPGDMLMPYMDTLRKEFGLLVPIKRSGL